MSYFPTGPGRVHTKASTDESAPMQSGSVGVETCTCKDGYVSVGTSNLCKIAVDTLSVVEVTVSLPMSKAEFEQNVLRFVQALADCASVEPGQVSVVSGMCTYICIHFVCKSVC